MSAEIDALMKGLGNLTGVIGTMVMNSNGLPIRATFRDEQAVHYAGLISELLRNVSHVLNHFLADKLMLLELDHIKMRSLSHHRTQRAT